MFFLRATPKFSVAFKMKNKSPEIRANIPDWIKFSPERRNSVNNFPPVDTCLFLCPSASVCHGLLGALAYSF